MPWNCSIAFLKISEDLVISGVVTVFYEVFGEGSDFQNFWKTEELILLNVAGI